MIPVIPVIAHNNVVHLTIIMAAERSIIDLFIDYKKQKKPKPSIKTSKIDALLVYFVVKSKNSFFDRKIQIRTEKGRPLD